MHAWPAYLVKLLAYIVQCDYHNIRQINHLTQ